MVSRRKQKKTTTQYTPVSLPTSMIQEANEIIGSHPELGYTGHSEFAKDALREKIEQFRTRAKPVEVPA